MNAVEIKDLYKSYEDGKIKALNGINLTIHDGEFVSIIGPSGSGKSTLLNMLGALDVPDSGSIEVAGQNLAKDKKLNEFRSQKIGFIFQLHNLIPNLSVMDNVQIPLLHTGMSSKDMKKRANELIGAVGLESKRKKKPNKLSGGERQRVAIARALVNGPPLLIADEPTGNLDPKNSLEIMQILEQINQRGITVIVSTHDYTLVDRFRKRVLTLDNGEIIRDIQAGTYGQ